MITLLVYLMSTTDWWYSHPSFEPIELMEETRLIQIK